MKLFCFSLVLVCFITNIVIIYELFNNPTHIELYVLNAQFSVYSGYLLYLYLKDFVYNKD